MSLLQVASVLAFRFVHSVKEPEAIVPLIVALRETNVIFGNDVYSIMLKKMETIPSNKMPAAMYQYLLWCRGGGCLVPCYESIFAILETQHEKLEVGSCISHVKLAFLHDKMVSLVFVKYAKNILKSGAEVSPFLLLLLLGVCVEPQQATKLIEAFFALRSSIASKLSLFGASIPGVDSKIWAGSDRTIKKLVESLQRDDEASITALITLGLRLYLGRNEDKKNTGFQGWGSILLFELFKVIKFISKPCIDL